MAKQYPEVVAELRRLAAARLQTIKPVKSQLAERLPAETTNKEQTSRARLQAGELGVDFYGLRAKLRELGVE